MKVQVFYPNKDGKIEFTKKDLEKLLQEVYNDGHADGYEKGKNERYYWYPNTITSPYYTSNTAVPKNVDVTPSITWSTSQSTNNSDEETIYNIYLDSDSVTCTGQINSTSCNRV